jgi:glutamine amidotransferase
MITLVDYGLGNIQAFANIYKQLGVRYAIAGDAHGLIGATRLILPGVGAFDWAMHRLQLSGMRPALDDLVLNQQVPVLGICVGMQMMATRSDEGQEPGLGWIQGEVKRFDRQLFTTKTKLPHMGWNDIFPSDHPLFAGIADPRFYFLHSYLFKPSCPDLVLADAVYGQHFAASVGDRNVLGVQFHPEKSHHWGVRLLSNFAEF